MAGGYDNEDRQAELEELRQAKEREAREKLEAERRKAALRRDNMAEAAELPRQRDREDPPADAT